MKQLDCPSFLMLFKKVSNCFRDQAASHDELQLSEILTCFAQVYSSPSQYVNLIHRLLCLLPPPPIKKLPSNLIQQVHQCKFLGWLNADPLEISLYLKAWFSIQQNAQSLCNLFKWEISSPTAKFFPSYLHSTILLCTNKQDDQSTFKEILHP